MAYEPQLVPAGQSNVYDEHTYKLRVLFGSSVITSYRSKDATIVRNSAGNYTITLPKNYEEIVGFGGSFIDASGAVLFWVIASSTMGTDGKVIVEVRTEAGTATDPTTGDVGLLALDVSSDYLNQKFTG